MVIRNWLFGRWKKGGGEKGERKEGRKEGEKFSSL